MKITAHTKLCMVIGDPVSHSLSPKIHTAGYNALGLDYVFVANQIKPEELSDFMQSIKTLNIRGVSVTHPHKITVIEYLDEIDPVAKKIGAVNTIVNDNGVIKGYNTDWIGVVNPLERLTILKNKAVAVLGAGGAARATVYGLTKQDAKFMIFNRTKEHAEKLVKEFGGKAYHLSDAEKIKQTDIIINTTSVGLHAQETPVPKKVITNKHIVFDIVYSAGKTTQLLKDAKAQGAQTIPGIEMLLEQGFAQFTLFTKHDAPMDAMRKAVV